MSRSDAESSLVAKLSAEMIGTLVLVLFGCGSAVIAGDKIGFLGISCAFGFSVLIMAYSIGGISGCHINPAVTIGLTVGGKFPLKDVVPYIIAQCIGAVIGAAILAYIASAKPGYDMALNGLGQNLYHASSSGGMGAAFVAELVLTAIFIFVILGSTSVLSPSGFAGIAIGIALVVIHLVGIPLTGTSVNPARSLGPAVMVGGDALAQLWLFWAAPMLGGAVGALMWRLVAADRDS